MKNNLIINSQLAFMFGVIIFLYLFASNKNQIRKTSKPIIEFTNPESPFITPDMVNNLLIENLGTTLTTDKDKVNLKNIEQTLNKHSMISQSDVYLSVDGKLKTIVKQKTPIARVFNNNTSYYIDYKGSIMPLSKNFSARVPLVYGDFNTRYKDSILNLLQVIYTDDFLKKNIIGLSILPNGSIEMKNREYKYIIEFGRPMEMNKKWNNYKAFFQKAVQDTLLDSYIKVNLKFTKQVICTK